MSAVKDRATPAERAEVRKIYVKALRDGALVKPDTCSWCGATDQPIHGHHPDYARPLMVVWVCAPCHRRHHTQYRTEHVLFRGVN